MPTDRASRIQFPQQEGRASRAGTLGAIALAHALLFWGLSLSADWREVVSGPTLLFAQVLMPERPPVPDEVPLPEPARRPPVAPALVEPPPLPLVDTPRADLPPVISVAHPAAEPPAPAAPAASAVAPPAPPTPVERRLSVTQVEYLTPPSPVYPITARHLREQGLVQVRVRVDEQGRPERALILRSAGSQSLDDAALTAVRVARFKPYTENGVAQPFWVDLPIEFQL